MTQLFVERRTQLLPGRRLHRLPEYFRPTLLRGRRSHFERETRGNAVQPAAERFRLTDRGCPASQRQERGLEDILRIVLMAEYTTAHAEDSRTMSLNKHLEGGLLMLGGKSIEELPVGCVAVTRQLANVP